MKMQSILNVTKNVGLKLNLELGWVCEFTRQHLVQVDCQQEVEDAVDNQHDNGCIKGMGTICQGGKHSTISMGLKVNHLTYVYTHRDRKKLQPYYNLIEIVLCNTKTKLSYLCVTVNLTIHPEIVVYLTIFYILRRLESHDFKIWVNK